MVANIRDTVLRLSKDERLDLIHDLWDSLGDEVEVDLTPEQRAELNRRLEDYGSNPDSVLTWDEIKSRILKRHAR